MHSTFWILSAAVFVCVAATSIWAQQQSEAHVLFDFETKKGQWISVNDNVMGGVSAGAARTTAEGMLDFSGVLSLENNGGFSSVRAMLEPGALSGHEGLALRVRGNGRTYFVNLHTESRATPGSWRATLPTERGRWREIQVPFRKFEWTVFGRKLPSRVIDPEQVQSLGFTIADKKEGPFRLQVDWIGAYGAAAREPDLVDRAGRMQDASIFLQAAEAAGMEAALRGAGPMTVFAPTDAAFAKLPREALAELLRPESKAKLRAVLLNHMVPGRLILGKHEVRTLQGASVTVTAEEPYRLGDTQVITANVEASNGVLHLIDSVLLPSEARPDTNEAAAQVIDRAISVGVPLYNGGNPEACTAVYEVAVANLLGASAPGLAEEIQKTLRSAADEAARETGPLEAAWVLRRALDAARQAVR